MQLKLQPIKLNKKIAMQSVKTAKYIHIGKDKIPIGNVRLEEVFKAYLLLRREEITQEKIDKFIKEF